MGTQTNARAITADETLKVTALVYLREALFSESYEDCRELIENAETFGAKPGEINRIFSDYFKTFQTASGGAKSKSRL